MPLQSPIGYSHCRLAERLSHEPVRTHHWYRVAKLRCPRVDACEMVRCSGRVWPSIVGGSIDENMAEKRSVVFGSWSLVVIEAIFILVFPAHRLVLAKFRGATMRLSAFLCGWLSILSLLTLLLSVREVESPLILHGCASWFVSRHLQKLFLRTVSFNVFHKQRFRSLLV